MILRNARNNRLIKMNFKTNNLYIRYDLIYDIYFFRNVSTISLMCGLACIDTANAEGRCMLLSFIPARQVVARIAPYVIVSKRDHFLMSNRRLKLLAHAID